jgi:hypothetical protein
MVNLGINPQAKSDRRLKQTEPPSLAETSSLLSKPRARVSALRRTVALSAEKPLIAVVKSIHYQYIINIASGPVIINIGIYIAAARFRLN